MALFKYSIRIRVETAIINSIYKNNFKNQNSTINELLVVSFIHCYGENQKTLWTKRTIGITHPFVHVSVFLSWLGWDSAGNLVFSSRSLAEAI